MTNESLDKKLDEIKKKNKRFGKWETGLLKAINDGRPLSLVFFQLKTVSKVDWDSMFIVKMINALTLEDTTQEAIYEILKSAKKSGVIRSVEMDDKAYNFILGLIV